MSSKLLKVKPLSEQKGYNNFSFLILLNCRTKKYISLSTLIVTEEFRVVVIIAFYKDSEEYNKYLGRIPSRYWV